MITIEINNCQAVQAVNEERVRQAATSVLAGEGFSSAQLSLAIVDDATIQELNRRYLNHDYPTDVLSFPLEAAAGFLEGEIVVSAQRAQQASLEHGWPVESELLLYVIHGVLHLTGYDDHDDEDRLEMRRRERHYLQGLGIAAEPNSGGRKP